MKRWYVLHTKPLKEDAVCKLLANAGVEIFLPRVEQFIRTRRFHYYKPGPLFPSYCFCLIDFSVAKNYHLVRYTRGVLKILGNPLPTPLSDDIIYVLKQRMTSQDMGKVVQFNRGDRLQVKRGLLKDLVGILEKPVTPEGRIHVLLKLVNHDMKAELHWSEVEKVAVA